MKLQDKLMELAEYGIGFNMHTGHVMVNITYKPGWTVIRPVDETVTFMGDEENENLYYYSAPMTTDMSAIFSAIDDTINYNKELEEKVLLFKEVVGELQEIFSKTPLSMLKNLTFSIPEEKPKQKTKKQADKTSKKTRKPRKKPGEISPTDISTADDSDSPAITTTVTDINEVIQLAMKEKGEMENGLV